MSDVRDSGVWVAQFVIKKFAADSAFDPDAEPYETIETGNQVCNGGISALWECLLGNGTTTGGQALTYFSSTNAAIGVGDSNAAFAATQNDLQAATNKLRVGMNATYPQHTDGTSSPATSILFQSTFGTSQANWAWEEIAAFNSPTAGTGRMLNRKVQALGTKTNVSSWQASLTVSITP